MGLRGPPKEFYRDKRIHLTELQFLVLASGGRQRVGCRRGARTHRRRPTATTARGGCQWQNQRAKFSARY